MRNSKCAARGGCSGSNIRHGRLQVSLICLSLAPLLRPPAHHPAAIPSAYHARDDREGIAAILSKRKPDFYKA